MRTEHERARRSASCVLCSLLTLTQVLRDQLSFVRLLLPLALALALLMQSLVRSQQHKAQRVGSGNVSTESYSKAARKVRLVSYATAAATAYRETEQQQTNQSYK